MSLFGGLPQPVQRRPLTQEELEDEQIADELADLPDDEGVEGLQPEPQEEQHLRRRPRRHASDEEAEPVPAEPVSSNLGRRPRAASEEGEEGAASPPKRPRVSPSPAPTPQEAQQAAGAAAEQGGDQVAMAIRKITNHISNPSKFAKASPLLRQLADTGTLRPEHRPLLFETVRAVYSLQPGKCKHLMDIVNKREAVKLTVLLEGMAAGGYFTKSEKAQIQEVYYLLGMTCNEMHTDDSFAFSKVLSKVRESVDALPEVYPGDEDDMPAFQHVTADKPGSYKAAQQPAEQHAPGAVQGATNGTVQQQQVAEHASPGHLAEQQQEQQQQQGVAGSAGGAQPAGAVSHADDDDPFGLNAIMKPAAPDDDDPFGLGSLMAAQAPKPKPVARKPKPAEPASTAWGPAELLAARRCAVLMCVQHARTFHKHAWAQTGIELLAEHCWKNRSRFSAAQQAEIDELWVWVRKSRTVRKQGPSAKEIKRDTTTFERARAEWSKATVSARGKVGSTGDAKSANWLG